jgi:hypothetical protein
VCVGVGLEGRKGGQLAAARVGVGVGGLSPACRVFSVWPTCYRCEPHQGTVHGTPMLRPPPHPRNSQLQLDRRPENFLAPWCAETGAKIVPYGVVAGGFLTDKYFGVKPDE